MVGFFQAVDDGAQVVFAGWIDGFGLMGGMGEGEDGMTVFVAQVEQVAVPPGGVYDEGTLFHGFPEVEDQFPVEVVFLPDDVDELPGGDQIHASQGVGLFIGLGINESHAATLPAARFAGKVQLPVDGDVLLFHGEGSIETAGLCFGRTFRLPATDVAVKPALQHVGTVTGIPEVRELHGLFVIDSMFL